jgi:serine/threonine protein kinase
VAAPRDKFRTELLKNNDWENLKDIFQAALERPPPERERFLSEACGGDQAMREEIRQLLSAFGEDEKFMESPAIGEVAETIVGKRETLKKGQQIRRYQIIEKIGAGGMGEVFLARDTELERPVALKVLPEIFAAADARVRRFIQEAKSASALNHPNIITIYEIVNFENWRFIATEFIEGETLRQRQKRRPLALSEIIDVAAQVCAALNAAHSAGIIHRDIKPENIMLREDGLVKVLDFGLAKLGEKQNRNDRPEASTRSVLTGPGMIMGTAAYMSPEQIRGVQDIDARADIWSLGVVLFEMLTNRTPFTGGSTGDVIASILKTETPVLSGEYPVELERIVTKALQKDRRARYQSIKDLTADLKSLNTESEISASNRITTKPAKNSTADVPRRITQTIAVQRFSFLHLVSILFVAALVSGGFWWFFDASEKTETGEILSLKNSEIITWSSSPGEQDSAGTFSPDGKMIAFNSSKSGTRNIWIKQTAAGEAIQITRDEFNNQNPIWSPGGDQLAYFSNRGDQYGVWQIPVFGGSPKLLTTFENGGVSLKYWSKKNLIYYNSPDMNLFALDVNSGLSSRITNFDSKQDVSIISVSPNEQLIAYIITEGEKRSIRITSLKDGVSRQITESATEIRKIIWHPDNRRIFYNTTVDGIFQIFVTDIDGGAPKQITFAERDSFVMDVSADGTKILYGSVQEESDVWSINLADDREFTVASDINSEFWADASPDGKTIAYQSIKNLSQGKNLAGGSIFARQINSDEPPAQLVENGFLPVWSPDARQIAFLQVEDDKYQLKIVKASGGEQKQLTVEGVVPFGFTLMPYNRTQTAEFSWSPDSRRIAYRSNKSGQYNIWLIDTDNSGETRLSGNADTNLLVFCPLWSADGKRLAYSTRTNKRTADDKFIYNFLVADAEDSKAIFQTDYFTRLIGWSPNKDNLILAAGAGDGKVSVPPEVSLFQISLKTGARRPLATLKDAYIFNINLSADRKQVAFVARHDGKDNIWVIPAAGGKAKKITENNDSRLYFSSLSWASDGGSLYYDKQSRYNSLSMLTNFKY